MATILARVGPNRVDAAAPRRLLTAVLTRFGNPLVLILLGAASVSAFTGDVPSFVIIGVIVLMSVILHVVQEHRAQNTADRLRNQVSLSSTALRDGKPAEIQSADIVPGDVVLLAAGDLVPADGKSIEARDLYVNEALLTGEAYPAEKDTSQVAPAATQAGAKQQSGFPRSLVFMGSSVVSGTGRAIVTATGARAQLGTIASALRRPPSRVSSVRSMRMRPIGRCSRSGRVRNRRAGLRSRAGRSRTSWLLLSLASPYRLKRGGLMKRSVGDLDYA